LVAAVLLASGTALNLSQRAFHKLPPTDGIEWVHRADGIYAERVFPNFAGARAGIAPGDKLIGVSLNGGDTTEQVTSVADTQIYLDAAGVDGNLTYLYQRPRYTFSDNYYYADLSHIDSVPRWTPSIIFLSIVGLIWLAVGGFVLFKQG